MRNEPNTLAIAFCAAHVPRSVNNARTSIAQTHRTFGYCSTFLVFLLLWLEHRYPSYLSRRQHEGEERGGITQIYILCGLHLRSDFTVARSMLPSFVRALIHPTGCVICPGPNTAVQFHCTVNLSKNLGPSFARLIADSPDYSMAKCHF